LDRFFEKGEFAVNLVGLLAVGACLFTAMSMWSEEIFPFAVGGLTLLIFLWRLFPAFSRSDSKSSEGENDSEQFHPKLAMGIILSSIALYILIALVGFSLSVLLYLVVMPLALGYRRRFSTIAVALAVYLILVVSIEKGFLTLPKGLLF
jgi:hypothetical protein